MPDMHNIFSYYVIIIVCISSRVPVWVNGLPDIRRVNHISLNATPVFPSTLTRGFTNVKLYQHTTVSGWIFKIKPLLCIYGFAYVTGLEITAGIFIYLNLN